MSWQHKLWYLSSVFSTIQQDFTEKLWVEITFVQFFLLKAALVFYFVFCCLPVRIQFISDHIGISSGRKLPQDFHGIICDRIKLCHLWSQPQPESTRSCLQRSPSILPLSLEASKQWDSHNLFGMVAALSWPGALLLLGRGRMRQCSACSWAEPACRSACA